VVRVIGLLAQEQHDKMQHASAEVMQSTCICCCRYPVAFTADLPKNKPYRLARSMPSLQAASSG
jgi:hypothetical protein